MTEATVASRPPGRATASRRPLWWLAYAALVVFTAFYVAPFVWMIVTSFKTNGATTAATPTWIPQPFVTEGYSEIANPALDQPVLKWFLNSAISAVGHTLTVLVTASMAAYALARMEFTGKRLMFGLIIATLFIPPIIFLIPNYLIVDTFGWIDTLMAVIVPPRRRPSASFSCGSSSCRCRSSSKRPRYLTGPTTGQSLPASCCRCPSPRLRRSRS